MEITKSVVIGNLNIDVQTSEFGKEYYFPLSEAKLLAKLLNEFFASKGLQEKYIAVLEEI